MSVSKEKSLIKEAVIQIGSGGTAGFIEVCIMHPLDLIKTRLQLQSKTLNKGSAIYYNGVFDAFGKMYVNEGFLSFYKGLLPPLLAETPKRAVKFFTFEQYKQFFMFGSPTPTPLTYSLAGLGAGVTEAIFVNPFEVVKVKLQANQSKVKEMPSTWVTAKVIVKEHGLGLQGLNKGLSATIARNGVFNMIYFGFYHSVKGFVPEFKNSYAEFFRKIFIGFVSGTLGSLVNIPFDVAKSRIQGPQPVLGEIKYKSTLQSIGVVYKEEGFLALYKGIVPKIMRLGPGGAIMLVIYEYAHNYLSSVLE